MHNQAGMKVETFRGVPVYSFDLLGRWPGLVQATFTRIGGVSAPPYDTLNVSFAVQDDHERVRANRELMAAAIEWDPARIVSARQVHGRRAVAVGRGAVGAPDVPDCDALVTDEPGVLLLMKFADCVPITLWDPVRRVVALVHAGWRGTVLGAPAAALELMVRRYRSRPSDVVAAVGPSIGPCCYQVGKDVAILASRTFAGTDVLQGGHAGEIRLDLWAANAETLMRAGVMEENIAIAGICTRCRSDLFFSHRAAGGRTGRFGVVAGIRDE